MEIEPQETVFHQMNQLYNRPFVPVEVSDDSNNPTKQLLIKLYDEMCYSDNEERDFFTTDPVVLRNTAINSLIGRGPITEEKIQMAMKYHLDKQRDFYENWKTQQAMSLLAYNSSYN